MSTIRIDFPQRSAFLETWTMYRGFIKAPADAPGDTLVFKEMCGLAALSLAPDIPIFDENETYLSRRRFRNLQQIEVALDHDDPALAIWRRVFALAEAAYPGESGNRLAGIAFRFIIANVAHHLYFAAPDAPIAQVIRQLNPEE